MLNRYFKDVPVYEWDDLDGKTIIIRVVEDSDRKMLCGYDPINNETYILAEKFESIK
jgi:hypothetical protein